MRLALIRMLTLGLVRDRGALLLTFLLPPLVFVIFALIFSRTSGTDLEIRFAAANELKDEIGAEVIAELVESGRISRVGGAELTEAAVTALVRSGEADAGLVIRPAASEDPLPDFVVIGAPSREIASTVLASAARQTLLQMNAESDDLPPMPVSIEILQGRPGVPVGVAYYAGGVAMLFVLMSSFQGAARLLEDRESGLLARIGNGPYGLGPVLDASFLFLMLQGIVQIALIFAVAWAGFGVSIGDVIGPWAVTTVLAAAVASALALAFIAFFSTKRQAEAFGPIVVLVLSAFGGSMVPRFIMPPSIQAVGWLTPNTWGLEAYAALLWRNEPLSALTVPWLVLGGGALVALIVARIVSRRWI